MTRVVALADGALVADLSMERRPVLALALSTDGRQLAIGDGAGYITLVDSDRWTIEADFRATLHGPVWALHFSADGANLHAGGLDPALYSWPVAQLGTGRPMAREEPSYLRAPEEMSNGERQFMRKCSICHTLGPDSARRAGPTLHGVFGRPAGSLPGYAYSPRLARSDIVWSERTIDALFDVGPDDYVTGSKMPQQRITDPGDRADLVAFLKDATKGSTD